MNGDPQAAPFMPNINDFFKLTHFSGPHKRDLGVRGFLTQVSLVKGEAVEKDGCSRGKGDGNKELCQVPLDLVKHRGCRVGRVSDH